MPDKYSSFTELALAEPEAFAVTACDLRSAWVIAAPHGGSIEPGTSEIAQALAGRDLSCYLFEGRKPQDNATLHITSVNFDEPRGLGLLRSARSVLTVHGEGSKTEIVYLGGLDEAAKARAWQALEGESFVVAEHAALPGRHPDNICNIGRSRAGLQVELSWGLRRTLFTSLRRADPHHPTPRLARFVAAVRGAILYQGI